VSARRADPWRPTRAQLDAAHGRTIRDVVAPRLDVVFCGINPGLWSAAVGHHFARPGNRFWRALHRAGFTDRELSPFEEGELLARGLGVTNLVRRGTATADELDPAEIRAGTRRLRRLADRWRPRWIALLGLGAYRTAFDRPDAQTGVQPERLGATRLWLLPNPSGLNASFPLDRIVAELRVLRRAARRSEEFSQSRRNRRT